MVLPVYAYGHPVLKKVGKEIAKDHPNLADLIDNMWETMYNAKGVGLAAPQVGYSLRLFLVDTAQIDKDKKKQEGIKMALINPVILSEEGEPWSYEEGCLSIPNINGDVERLPSITIKYFDQDFVEHTKTFDGMNARVIQHEYDHIEGKLFTEKLSPLKRRMLQRKLENIRRGKASADYVLKFV